MKCYELPGLLLVWVTETSQQPVTRLLFTVGASYCSVNPNTYVILLKNHTEHDSSTQHSHYNMENKTKWSENQSVEEMETIPLVEHPESQRQD